MGFYSSFIVAKEVEVVTRPAGQDSGTRWVSSGEADFTVEPVADAPRGTRVTLKLRPDATEFADNFRIRSLIRQYSDHVGVPVMMAKLGDDSGDDGDEPELETVNEAKALWTRPRNDVSEDEYKAFYKHVSHDFEDPASWSHNKVEGKLEYTSLLYIPKRAPFDLWNREVPRGLKLYVQRVFIMDEADQFLPLYLRFVRGIVDSSDLPLNVSREILQSDDRIRTIKNALTKRVLDMLGKMDAEAYAQVWDEFGQVLKEGIGEDFANKDDLLGLLRFASTENADSAQRTSLKDYVARMKEGVDKIYYLIADSDATGRQSPHLEAFRERGIEVLLLSDRIDEWWMSSVDEFDGKKLQDVARGELDLGDIGKNDASGDEETDDEDQEPLLKRIAEVLDGKVESVRKSSRLTDSPACLVLGEQDMGIQMRRIMAATGQSAPDSKPHLEVNLRHPLIAHLNREVDEDRFADLTTVIFDQASLAEGNTVAEPSRYVQRVNKLLLDLLAS